MIHNQTFESEIKSYQHKQSAAVKLIQIVNSLWFGNSIELIFFRKQLFDRPVNTVLHLHQQSHELAEPSLSIFETLRVAQAMQHLQLSPSRIDIGTLALEVRNQNIEDDQLLYFIKKELISAQDHKNFEPRDVVLYGFGRIGRLLARELISKAGAGKQLRLRAIVTRDTVDEKSLYKRATLLRNDSIHGDFKGEVDFDLSNESLIINGTTVKIISAKNPEDIDYTAYDIHNALIIDNTGAFRDKKELSRHLTANGASQVLLTAPGKGVPNIVYGVNNEMIDLENNAIFSAASCTTNAISPILEIINKKLGVNQGHIETIHSYTNDQNLVDNMHSKSRRGRAAGLNMVITETGAGSAVSKVLPELAGKLTSNAIRVPVPNGSLAILNLQLNTATSVEEVNTILKESALKGHLIEQINYSNNDELVSSDIIGTTAASVVDAPATIVSVDGKSINLYVWYDNEYGYTHQVMRLARHIAGVRRYVYY